MFFIQFCVPQVTVLVEVEEDETEVEGVERDAHQTQFIQYEGHDVGQVEKIGRTHELTGQY